MIDLVIGVSIIGLLSALLFVMSLRLSATLSLRMSNLLGIMTVTLIVGYVVHVQGQVAISRVLPFSNLIVVGNWQPLMVSVLAGLIWRRLPGCTWRRTTATSALVCACLFGVYRPILARAPQMHDRWEGVVCLQTSAASCTPAAAATLLSAHGVWTTEQEMALLCLTSEEGTQMQGLYRGMRLKTAGTPWDVYMFSGASIDDLRGAGPVLLSVELRAGTPVDTKRMQGWGWIPNVPHSVVLFGFIGDNKVDIGDPSIGREIWSLDDLKVLWHGEGAQLVRAR